MYNNLKVVAVLPAYNAALTLERTYREIPFNLVDEVTDCSPPPIRSTARRP